MSHPLLRIGHTFFRFSPEGPDPDPGPNFLRFAYLALLLAAPHSSA
ncbi:MAG: hypothetical protein MI923_30075 [Phycisphaerales bacterium]|nr:hypothetical protein [Phycisphaerales bacterium]